MIHHDFEFEQDDNGEYVATFKVPSHPSQNPELRSGFTDRERTCATAAASPEA